MAKRSRFTNGVVISSGRPSAAANPAGETAIMSIKRYSVSFNPASIAAATTAEQSVTVTGVAAGDIVLSVTKPTVSAGIGIVNARVSAANTVQLTFVNATAGAVDPGAETYEFVIGTFATT